MLSGSNPAALPAIPTLLCLAMGRRLTDEPSGLSVLLELLREAPAFLRGSWCHLALCTGNRYSLAFRVSLCSGRVMNLMPSSVWGFFPLPVGILLVNKPLFFHFYLLVFISYWWKQIVGTLSQLIPECSLTCLRPRHILILSFILLGQG